VIQAKVAGRRRQASVSPQGQENPQVLPVDLCAFFISHASKIANFAGLEGAHLSWRWRKRMGEVSDIAQAVLYLEDAGFVTGETLHVDGGQIAAQ